MRLIQLKVPRENYQAVREILEAEDIEYVVIDTMSETDDSAVIQFPLPRPAVEPVFERLSEIGLDEDFRVSLSAETIQSTNRDNLVDRFLYHGDYRDVIPRDELTDKARDAISNPFTYYFMTALGTIVATSGLFLNSAAVVMGAMILAPQLGAALTASVGIAIDDREMYVNGMAHQVIGLGFGLLGATVFAAIVRVTDIVVIAIADIMAITQISTRASPGILSMVIAVTAGAAASFNLATQDRPTGPLVGAMMSVALIPAAATAGIGIAWVHHRIVIGALVLLVVNVASLNLAGPAILWLLGYRPAEWGDTASGLSTILSLVPILILLLGAFLGAGAVLGQQVTYTYTVNTVVEETLDDEYAEVELRRVSAPYNYLRASNEPAEIEIVIDRPDGTRYPRIATALQRNISNETGVTVTVTVEYVDSKENEPVGNNRSTPTDGTVVAPTPRGVSRQAVNSKSPRGEHAYPRFPDNRHRRVIWGRR